MYLAIWFLLGALLVWIIAEGRTAAWDYFFADAPVPRPQMWALALIATFFLAVIALLSDNAILPQDFLALRSKFLGPRFEFFLLGALCGAIAHHNKERLDKGLVRLVKAILGDKENTAWAFQSAIAIIVIAFIVFAVRPDFFDYLRSFKVGGFEATFAERTNNTIRDTDFHLNDQRDLFIVEQYAGYEANFINPSSPRGYARRLISPKALIDQTDPIAVTLVNNYLWPVMGALSCYNSAHQLDLVSHDTDVASFLYTWQQLLISIRRGEIWDDKVSSPDRDAKLQGLLTRIKFLQIAIVKRADSILSSCASVDAKAQERQESSACFSRGDDSEPRCRQHKTLLGDILAKYRGSALAEPTGHDQEVENDVACLNSHYEQARVVLKQLHEDTPQVAAVVIVDSYLTAAIADLAALVSGQQKDKAVFLTTMLDGLPKVEEFITPGMINVFHALGDAKVQTLALWPLGQTLNELNYSLTGVELMMARSAERLEKLGDEKANGSPPAGHPAAGPSCNLDRDLLPQIYDIYLRNLLIVLSTKIKYFNEIELSGRSMSDATRQEWAESLGRLIALLRGRLESSISAPDRIPVQALDDRKKKRLPMLDLKDYPDILFEAELAAALSLIIMDGRGVRPSAPSCNMSLFLLNAADGLTESIVRALELNRPQEIRWQQLFNVVAQRVAASCNWTDRRGSDESKDKEK